jgi:hypothetical protein
MFQEARQNKQDPNEFLNQIVGGFNNQQKQQWNEFMSHFNNKG